MRTFVAVFPPPGVQAALVEAARTGAGGAFRLTASEKVHLTLRFLGETDEASLERVTEALAALPARHDPFPLTTRGFGVFPSERRARVLWAGVDEGAEPLLALAQDVEASLAKIRLGHQTGPYVPHLTVGRARRPIAFDPAGLPATDDRRFMVEKMHLVESRPGDGGVVYASRAVYAL